HQQREQRNEQLVTNAPPHTRNACSGSRNQDDQGKIAPRFPVAPFRHSSGLPDAFSAPVIRKGKCCCGYTVTAAYPSTSPSRLRPENSPVVPPGLHAAFICPRTGGRLQSFLERRPEAPRPGTPSWYAAGSR